MTLPLAYHLEFSVFFDKWYATLSALSISMFFVQLQRHAHMVEVTRTLLYDALVCSVDSRCSFCKIYFFLFLSCF